MAVINEQGAMTSGSAAFAARARRAKHVSSFVRCAVIIVFLAAWQASGVVLRPIFISTPSTVASDIIQLVGNGQLPSAFASSLLELVVGLLLALVIGVGVGLLMGRIRLVERALNPLVAFGNATPSITLLPVMVVWLGIGHWSRIAFILVLGVWIFIVNTLAGTRAARAGLRDVGMAFGMSGWSQTWRIYLPATMPYLFVGARMALVAGAVGMVLSGQEVGQAGLGGLASNFGSYFQTGRLVATIGTTTGLTMLLFWAVRVLQARAFPWISDTSAGRRGPQ